MGFLIGLAVVLIVVVVVSIVAARRGTPQVTTWGDPAIERERIRGTGTGSKF